MGELIAILSGKGGTGKTSVCAGLAEALALQDKTVLCVDCDVGLRNLDIALGLSQIGALSFQDVCSGNYTLDQATRHSVYPGLSFLTAPVNCTPDEVDKEAFGEMLQQARQLFDYVLLDAPAGIEVGFQLSAAYADRVILVTSADPAAIRDASRASDVLEAMGKKNVRMVLNRVNEKMISAMGITVDDIMDQSGLPLLGLVPEDENVPLAAAFRQPLLGYEKKGAAAACKRIAKRIQGNFVPVKLK
ncbi:MAG: AAA family ATPase [Oscillospiraceae bacterium]|nr:AAA family ATPase [Oscillospiraceae bacterium]